MRIAVLGAGLAGICGALELKDSDKIEEVIIFEKNNAPGGLIKSITDGEYIWDYGAYTFDQNSILVKNYPFLFEKIPVERKVWLNKKYNTFPIDFINLFKSQNFYFFLKFVFQLITGLIRRIIEKSNLSINQWLINRITKVIFFESKIGIYISKVQGGISIDRISSILAKEKFIYLFSTKKTLTKMINLFKVMFANSGDFRNKNWEYYPIRTGVTGIIKHLVTSCKKNGITIRYEVKINQINRLSNGNVTIVYKQSDHIHSENFDHIVSTINLLELVKLYKPDFRKSIPFNETKLNYTNSIIVMIGLKNRNSSNEVETIYSYETKHKWRRITCIRRIDKPTSIIVEFTNQKNNSISVELISEEIIQDLIKDLNLFNSNDIKTKRGIVIEDTYPIYYLGYEKYVKYVKSCLDHNKITLLGRQGLYKYYDTDDVILVTRNQISTLLGKI